MGDMDDIPLDMVGVGQYLTTLRVRWGSPSVQSSIIWRASEAEWFSTGTPFI